MNEIDQRDLLFLLVFVIIAAEVFFIFKLSTKTLDTAIVILCILAQINLIYGIETAQPHLTSLSHFAFGLSVIAIPLLSSNMWLLSIVAIVLMITLVFRKKNGDCPISTFDENVIDYSFDNRIDWDIGYLSFGVLAILKMLYVYNRKNK